MLWLSSAGLLGAMTLLLIPGLARAPEGAGGACRFAVSTDAGAFTIELDEAGHPASAEEFRKRLAFGLYDGAVFARRPQDRLIQLGLRYSAGEAPEMLYQPEQPALLSSGDVAWAVDDSGISGYAFFICLEDEAGWAAAAPARACYTGFARVTAGQEIVGRLVPGDVILRIQALDIDE